jgi:dTDP-4-amino-4,6-dideoxygalactose transaminase
MNVHSKPVSVPEEKISWWRTGVGEEEIANVVESIRAEHISGGPVTDQLEAAIGDTLGVPYVVCTTSGSMALTLALMTLGVGPGDEVIVPNRTFMATAHAALMLSASVRLVDVLPDIPALDVSQVEAAITPATKAIIPVHLNGRAVDMAAVNAIAKRHGIAVVEDTAQAMLSKGPNGWLGTQSDLGCFSLGMTKLLSTGQGGFVVTSNETLYTRMRRVQNHGVVDTLKDSYEFVGSNFKFNDVLASIGLAQLERGPAKVAHVTKIYETYKAAVDELDFVDIVPVKVGQGETPLWTEVVCADRTVRTHLMEFLAERRIDTRQFLPDLDLSAYLNNTGDFSHSRKFGNGGLFLPGGPTQPMKNVHATIDALREYASQHV